MLKIGVIGAGHLGKIHIKLLKELNEIYELVGFYDFNQEKSNEIEDNIGVKNANSFESLLKNVDVIDIVTPTFSHFKYAEIALQNKKHVFIEKPITNTIEEAEILMKLCEKQKLKVQVGHVERFNPAFISVKNIIKGPMFIETHRLSEFNPRGTDVPVILDLMIHDIDIVLSLIKSKIISIHASGVPVISNTPDICNARIEFEDNSVANLTTSRISMNNMRKTRIFQKDTYITIDFLEKKSKITQIKDIKGIPDPLSIILDANNGIKKQISFINPQIIPINSIKEELKEFAISIIKDKTPIVTMEDGYKALQVATQIFDKCKMKNNF